MPDADPQKLSVLSAHIEGLEAAVEGLNEDPSVGISLRRIARSLQRTAQAVGAHEIAPGAQAATAILAGGCFWCMEADFEKLEGVSDVISGFTGGSHPNPTYNGDHSGHYEAVKITYDPMVIDYQGILDHYWVNIDPFDAHGQFCDKGHEYLAAIFVANSSAPRPPSAQ